MDPPPSAARDIIRVSLSENGVLELAISPWLLAPLLIAAVWIAWRNRHILRRYGVVELNVSLGGIGHVRMRPSDADLVVAHRIWTELVTRKAALEIDPEHDVIVEVYDSWYRLFGKVRDLIGDVPPERLRNHDGTRQLIRVAVDALNKGLRPHLTRWQARFRAWYAAQEDVLRTRAPQEVQRDYPHFDDLIEDMLRVNKELIAYAKELEKLVSGKEAA